MGQPRSKAWTIAALILCLLASAMASAVFSTATDSVALVAGGLVVVFLFGAGSMTLQLVRSGKPGQEVKPAATSDFNPEKGEVYEKAPRGTNSRDRAFARWEEGLTCAWEGELDIEFTYEKMTGDKSRRKVTLQRVMLDNYSTPYLMGFCHTRHEERTFNADKITTKIRVGGKRYDIEEFMWDVLDVSDEVYP